MRDVPEPDYDKDISQTCKKCGNKQFNDIYEGRTPRCEECWGFMEAASEEDVTEFSRRMHHQMVEQESTA